jgi:hypothetical protein
LAPGGIGTCTSSMNTSIRAPGMKLAPWMAIGSVAVGDAET